MSFPVNGDVAVTRKWLDSKGFQGLFVGFEAEALLGLSQANIQRVVPGDRGLRLWGLINRAREIAGKKLFSGSLRSVAVELWHVRICLSLFCTVHRVSI